MLKLLTLMFLCCVPALLADSSIFPYKYSETVLDNGLKVILIPIKNNGLVSFYTIVHAGARDEVQPGKSGFAHFFEHMMFRGTIKYPQERYNQIITEMGADTNASTWDDHTQYYVHFPKKYLEKVMELESDRFMNLKYNLPTFQTEAKAVLGEYNKNFANPLFQLETKLRDVAFEKSTYKHTAMGFLKDIQDMPNQFEYSLTFFQRFYRPENSTILITGDFVSDKALSLLKKYYSAWKRGDYKAQVPTEAEQQAEKRDKIDYPGDTLPMIAIGYKAPAYAPQDRDYAALTLLASLAFGETSPLYQRLVLKEQKLDLLAPDYEPHRDPYLFNIYARLKKQEDLAAVEQAISQTITDIQNKPPDPKQLADLKSNLKYGFLMGLDTSRNTATVLSPILAHTRGIPAVEQTFQTYETVTAEDIQKVAKKYLQNQKQTVVTLVGAKS
jgi:zinc protease